VVEPLPSTEPSPGGLAKGSPPTPRCLGGVRTVLPQALQKRHELTTHQASKLTPPTDGSIL